MVIRVHVYSSVSEFIMEISLDKPGLVLGPRTLRCTFPIHQDRRVRRLQHLGKLLVDLAPNVIAG